MPENNMFGNETELQFVKCPDCGKMALWDTMIWLNGTCTCAVCYQKKRNKLDKERDNNAE
jgi:formylmethanofuran dehydrogenase subunit E